MFAGWDVILKIGKTEAAGPFILSILDNSDGRARHVCRHAMNVETAASIRRCFSADSFCCWDWATPAQSNTLINR